MIIDYVRYKITIVIDNLITNNLDRLEKNITKRNIDLETNIPIEIDKKNILNYFTRELKTYCTNTGVTMENLALDGYEILSKTTGVDIYFKSEDINNFSYEPSIMANLVFLKEMPVLRSEQIDDTTIKWYFEDNNSVNYLKDDNDIIIAELPLNVNYYIETSLTPGQTYSRRIVTTNEFGTQLESTVCSLTLKVNQKASVYDKFQIEKRKEDIQTIDTQYSSKLKAFASGIGDNEDCMLYKADDTKFSRRFKLYNKIYGVRASNDIKHNAIQFKYRYKLLGTVDYLGYEAKFTVKITATKCVDYINDPDPTLFGAPIVCEKELVYTLDDTAQVANIFMYQFFPEFNKDYKQRYKFDIVIKSTSGHARVYDYTYGYHNIINGNSISFSEHGYFDHTFTVAAVAFKKQKEYEEVYPNAIYEPLVGVINGDFEMSVDGLKNMRDAVAEFETSTAVYDKKYYCVFEEMSPAEAYVRYRFDHPVTDEVYTITPLDGVTFYSNCVFADDSEHREFITQTEVGPYIIDDNRMHKYNYDIKNISVDIAAYKSFELDVVASTNDIVIVSAPDVPIINADGTVDMNIDVSCRNLQNATARWSPNIHNGYYYYNQKEYFLYSQCVADGQNMILDDLYSKANVSIKVIAEETLPAGVAKTYDLSLTTKDELLTDEYHYEWENFKVWPKPVEVYNDYYMEFSPYYEYYTQPFEFDTKITSYTSISWAESGLQNSSIEVYAIAYDDVYGVWYSPVRIYNGAPVPLSLKPSKVLILKFVLRPSRKPKLETRTMLFSCESDWKNNKLNYLSYNINFLEETLQPKSRLTNGVFVSKFIDLGDTVEAIKGRSIKFDPTYEGDIEFYIQQADSKVELTESMVYANWAKVDIGVKKTDLKRFIRYMIVLKPRSKLFYMDMTVQRYEYTSMKKSEYLPGFGSIYVKAKYDPTDSQNSYEHVISYELTYDGEPHVLIESADEYLTNFANAEGFDKNNITTVRFVAYDSDSTDFEISGAGDIVNITSRDVVFDNEYIENNQGGAEFIIAENKLTVSPIPQQYAPIIIYGEADPEPYTQVFFTDVNNRFVLTNTEEFESLGFQTLYLKYIDIDPASIEITIDGISNKAYTIINNIIKFDAEIAAGSVIKVKYKIKKSFTVNYNYESDSMDIVLYKESQTYTLLAGYDVKCGAYLCGTTNLVNPQATTQEVVIDRIRIYYETNKLSACRQLSNISFNPIYNVRHAGYVYLCDYQDPVQTVKVYPADDSIYANGKDTMNVLIQCLDKNLNPVEGIDVNIAAVAGNLKIVNEKTDINGVIHCIYTATDKNCIDVIKAIVDNNAKGQAKIVNRKL